MRALESRPTQAFLSFPSQCVRAGEGLKINPAECVGDNFAGLVSPNPPNGVRESSDHQRSHHSQSPDPQGDHGHTNQWRIEVSVSLRLRLCNDSWNALWLRLLLSPLRWARD